MELLTGQSHRNMLAFLSKQTYIFIGHHLPRRKLFTTRTWSSLQNPAGHESASLTLASIGFRSKDKTGEEDKLCHLGDLKSATRVPYAGVKLARNGRYKATGKRSVPEMEAAAPFTAKSFSELNLSALLVERLEKEHFTVPTDVQSAAIPIISQNQD